MMQSLDVFFEMQCLTDKSSLLNGYSLQKKWLKSADKRIIGIYLQKFINYNSHLFNFLGVEPFMMGSDQNISIYFRSSQYIGTIPLRASDTGKQIGDFVVTPRFSERDKFENYIEILNLLEKDINPEFIDSIPLASGKNFRPPLYLEAIKFINALEILLNHPWRKFNSIEKVISEPTGQINWNKYSINKFKTENQIRFPAKKNILSIYHKEYAQIRFVFDFCKMELLSANTPLKIKNGIRNRLVFLEEKLYFHKPIKTNHIIEKASDNPKIKLCKEAANKILSYNLMKSTAWRVDFSDVFEKFVQHIFKEVLKDTGGSLFSNCKINSRTKTYYSWELKHLEPDAIYQNGGLEVFIDAKYKSNLYSKFGNSDILKEVHRADLHQIMAYSSFSKSESKYGFLCYPASESQVKQIVYKNRINDVTNTVCVFGIPLKAESVHEIKALIIKQLYSYYS